MTQEDRGPDEATKRAAKYLAEALQELQQAGASRSGEAAAQAALQALTEHIERQLAAEAEQRLVLVGQLTGLATSLDLLVVHLQSLAQLMVDVVERVGQPNPAPSTAASPAEPSFLPGGEGLSLILTAVPGFQALMDIQKALLALAEVDGVSVERFQEGDSRLLLHLVSPIIASQLAGALQDATQQAVTIEESRPELSRLSLKIVPAT